MKNKFYSLGAKILVWIILVAGAVFMAVGGTSIGMNLWNDFSMEEMRSPTSYETSGAAGEYLVTQLHETLDKMYYVETPDPDDYGYYDSEVNPEGAKENLTIISQPTKYGTHKNDPTAYFVEPSGGTNALIYIKNVDTNEVFTNVKQWANSSLDEIIADYGTSLYRDLEKDDSYYAVSNLNDANEVYNSMLSDAALVNLDSGYTTERVQDVLQAPDEYQLFLGLNTNYPLKTSDSYLQYQYYEGYKYFNDYLPIPVVAWFFIGAIMVPLGLVLLGLQTGHKENRKDPVVLTSFDRFPIEVWIFLDIVLFAIGGVLLMAGCAPVARYSVGEMGYGFLMRSSCCWMIPAALVIVLTLAKMVIVYMRRIKAHQIGGSIIKSIVKYLMKGSERARQSFERNVKDTHKTIVRFVLLVLLNVIVAMVMGAALEASCPGIGFIMLLLLLIGNGYILFHKVKDNYGKDEIKAGLKEFANGNFEYQIDTEGMSLENAEMSEHVNRVKDGLQTALNDRLKSERLKTDLIANVSHDLRTPLTSIINYVDILKKEDIQDEKIAGYIDVLVRKSARLKQLTDDLIEASKISSGNITLDIQNLNLSMMVQQTLAEFEEKFAQRNLQLVTSLPEEPMMIRADGRQMFRVLENLYNNAAKYAMPFTRVYVTVEKNGSKVVFTIKNISEHPLNVNPDELVERFVRGDASRSTEGSGLGLEIARNLTTMQGGQFDIDIDGDLFKVVVSF